MSNPEIDINDLPARHSKKKDHRDDTRRWVALGLLCLIALLAVLIAGGVILGCTTIDEAKDLSLILLAPIVGVFGIVVGFFFGQDRD